MKSFKSLNLKKKAVVLAVLLFLIVFSTLFALAFSALLSTLYIQFTGQISNVLINSLIGQYGNGTYYANNLDTGQTYAVDPYYASRLINNAISIANAQSGGGTVQIGTGSFCLNETLVPKSNVYLNASYGAILYQNHPATLSDSISLMFTDKVTDNFILNGGIWDGNKTILSDHRGSGTWNSNFGKYFGVGLYYGGSTNVKVMNAVIRNVIGFGLSLGHIYNGYVYNCSAINCGDNPITVEGFDANYSTIVEYCTVVGGQDVGINTFHANNVTIRYNTVSNVTQDSGASHWGIAAENSQYVNIIGNSVSDCDYDIVSTSDNVLISQNRIDGTHAVGLANIGIQIQTSHNNIISNNNITNTNHPLSTYGNTQTFDTQFLNNLCNVGSSGYGGSSGIAGTRTTISGGVMYATSADGAICLMNAVDVNVVGVKFLGYNGILDYGLRSDNVYIAQNDFSALTGTKVSLANCYNVTYYMNIGYP